MSAFVAEMVGTAILILLGNGVVANVLLNDTNGNDSGWIVITWGWGIAVFVAVFTVSQFSGAHINPAVTVGLACAGLFKWSLVPLYISAQVLGACIGSVLVWFTYKDHYKKTNDENIILATHSTIPRIRNYTSNFITELIGTFILVLCVIYLVSPGFIDGDGKMLETVVVNGKEVGFGLGALSALPVGLLVLGIGLSLGGPTGYAINPARDFGPRLVHSLLPISNKGTSDWGYAWVPILAPLAGAVLAAAFYLLV